MLKFLMTGLILSLVFATGAYAQQPCQPKLAQTEGAGKGPKLAESEAGKGPKLAAKAGQ